VIYTKSSKKFKSVYEIALNEDYRRKVYFLHKNAKKVGSYAFYIKQSMYGRNYLKNVKLIVLSNFFTNKDIKEKNSQNYGNFLLEYVQNGIIHSYKTPKRGYCWLLGMKKEDDSYTEEELKYKIRLSGERFFKDFFYLYAKLKKDYEREGLKKEEAVEKAFSEVYDYYFHTRKRYSRWNYITGNDGDLQTFYECTHCGGIIQDSDDCFDYTEAPMICPNCYPVFKEVNTRRFFPYGSEEYKAFHPFAVYSVKYDNNKLFRIWTQVSTNVKMFPAYIRFRVRRIFKKIFKTKEVV